ncbi:SAM-dependent methyltransferase [Thermomonospora sp. CIF 1]|uniref:SAM-dependent methyltransferase n=1 Tax=Thermomonospora sp. CIF 1 TaxID=1916083 RepID=UPI000A8623B6|nr:SAM-dependent methyltransferase [Thermomonospora sp. CIF 1]
MSGRRVPEGLNTRMPHPARVYDYWLGGENNFPADRELGDLMARISPDISVSVQAVRAFFKRAVRHLVREAGIRQFLDLGSGLPTQGNVHEVAQRLDPECRVVYVDSDPDVCAHGTALLEGPAAERTRMAQGDIRYPAMVLGHPAVTELLDFDRPVAVLFNAILHVLEDRQEIEAIVGRFADALVPGSRLLISLPSAELLPPGQSEALYGSARMAPYPIFFRTYSQILRLFSGFDLVEPGLVHICQWRPDGPVPQEHRQAAMYGGIGVKR